MATLTLDEFLLARIAEDEANADREMVEVWRGGEKSFLVPGRLKAADTRVLAECDAKRRIIELVRDEAAVTTDYAKAIKSSTVEFQWQTMAMDTLRLLALPYADHPDYREEWRPQ